MAMNIWICVELSGNQLIEIASCGCREKRQAINLCRARGRRFIVLCGKCCVVSLYNEIEVEKYILVVVEAE